VTVQRKLFVAVALVAAGFGVAALLGKPTCIPPSAGGVRLKQMAASNSLRLVPDLPAKPGDRESSSLSEVAPPLWSSLQPQSAALPVAQPLGVQKPAPSQLSPRAKLRNEAPRPLAIDSRATATIEAMSAIPISAGPANHAPPPGTNSAGHSAGSSTSSFEQGPVSTPVITASHSNESDATAISHPVIPPPWPAPDEDAGPRTHVVIDGDSLARLAGRYLDDPRRGGEIFEANRGVLSDPELLPIRTELVIPNRSQTAAIEGNSPHSFVPSAVAIHATEIGRLVPVRPIPVGASVVPRAQLSRPLPVE
jgi:hypothetical protein